MNAVEEHVSILMQHALQVFPSNPSFLRTQADLLFGKTIFHLTHNQIIILHVIHKQAACNI